MFRVFAPTEPPKKKPASGPPQQCIIGAVDELQLDCNQCKHATGLSCPDRKDAITQEPLEPNHVEYVAPDHNLKCCYNASTLDRCRSPEGYLLQPPHFRIPMINTDAQKVASAFGLAIQKQSDQSFGQDRVQQSVSNNQRLIAWARTHMKASQLWLCPICWTHMTCRPEQMQDSAAITSERKGTDPIQRCIDYILSHVREGGFRMLVATFSTSKTGLKHHLRNAHNVPSAPSELLEAYSLRGDDGILHRYLSERGYRNESAHGALLSYWRHNPTIYARGVGFNKFIYLYMHYYAPRITSAALSSLTEDETGVIWTTLTRPYSLEETAEDREMFDDAIVCESGPVKTEQEEEKQEEEAADVAAKIQEYGSKDVTGYLTHDELEALIEEERVQSDGSYSSESEDEMVRYRRELSEKKKRLRAQEDDSEEPISDSDSDDEFLSRVVGGGSAKIVFGDDSEEDD